MTADRFPWSYRSTTWVLGVIGYIADADDVTWSEVVDHFTDDAHQWRTVEKLLYELTTFGVIRLGKERRIYTTTLGRAWLQGHLIPIPTSEDPS